MMAQTLRILAALGMDEGVDDHLTFCIPKDWYPPDLQGYETSRCLVGLDSLDQVVFVGRIHG